MCPKTNPGIHDHVWNTQACSRLGFGDIVYIPLGQVHISLLANNVGVTATDTLNFSQGVLDLALAIHVRVQQTKCELDFCPLQEG